MSSFPLLPDILRLICDYLASDEPTLASLARTCSAFEGPALDVLWSNLTLADNPLLALVKCLPLNILAEETRPDYFGNNKRFLVLREPLVATDCMRVSQYAKRVKTFSFFEGQFDEPIVDVTVLQALQVALEGATLLPNLRRLSWHSNTNSFFSSIPMFLGPHLIDIDFSCSSECDSKLYMSLLPVLRNLHPSLKHISFICDTDKGEEERETEYISKELSKWQHLETLRVANLTYESLLKLSRLPTLKSLCITKWEPLTAGPIPCAPSGGFLTLKGLEVCTQNTDSCILLLEMMDSSPIESMKLAFEWITTYESLERVFIVIRNNCNHDTLKSLNVNDDCKHNSPIDRQIQMPNYLSIKPLLVFGNLESLTFKLYWGFKFSDSSETKEMAQSWTKLRCLKFMLSDPWCRSLEKSSITLQDLLPFAEHCPDLEQLGLFLDAMNPPDIDVAQRPLNGVSIDKVTIICVGDSPAKEPARIAAFLSSFLPSLRKIEIAEARMRNDNDEDDEDEDRDFRNSEEVWLLAKKLVPAFATVRKQERASRLN